VCSAVQRDSKLEPSPHSGGTDGELTASLNTLAKPVSGLRCSIPVSTGAIRAGRSTRRRGRDGWLACCRPNRQLRSPRQHTLTAGDATAVASSLGVICCGSMGATNREPPRSKISEETVTSLPRDIATGVFRICCGKVWWIFSAQYPARRIASSRSPRWRDLLRRRRSQSRRRTHRRGCATCPAPELF
jgi:hypothetical protein